MLHNIVCLNSLQACIDDQKSMKKRVFLRKSKKCSWVLRFFFNFIFNRDYWEKKKKSVQRQNEKKKGSEKVLYEKCPNQEKK